MVAMIKIEALRPGDRASWEVLARGYKAFYRNPIPDDAYEATWRRLLRGTELCGIGARLNGNLIGIAHYLFHPTFWSGEACYLQDLFAAEPARPRRRPGADRAGGRNGTGPRRGPAVLAHPGGRRPGPRAV